MYRVLAGQLRNGKEIGGDGAIKPTVTVAQRAKLLGKEFGASHSADGRWLKDAAG